MKNLSVLLRFLLSCSAPVPQVSTMEHTRMPATARIAILIMLSQVCAGLDLDSLITNAVKQARKDSGDDALLREPNKADGSCNQHCENMYTKNCLRHNCEYTPAEVRDPRPNPRHSSPNPSLFPPVCHGHALALIMTAFDLLGRGCPSAARSWRNTEGRWPTSARRAAK